MTMEQNFQQQLAQMPLGERGISSEKWKSISSAMDEIENNQSGGGFDCNICLDLVQDPVVTFCGHLYCWPCIYKWIHSQSNSTEDHDLKHPQCPVCKDEVSEKTLIPLYGRGLTTKGKAMNLGIMIPQRPPSPRCGGAHALIGSPTTNNHQSYPQQQATPRQIYPGMYTNTPPLLNLSGGATNVLNHPMIGMIGEMVYARMARNQDASLYAYPNSPNSYYHLAAAAGGASPRMRRQMMQADRSLGRVCFFLCCCVVICLLLF